MTNALAYTQHSQQAATQDSTTTGTQARYNNNKVYHKHLAATQRR